LQVAAEAEHARRAAAEHEVAQRHLTGAKVLDDQPLPILEVAQHRRSKARPAARTHESPQRRVFGLIHDVELGKIEQLPIDAEMAPGFGNQMLIARAESD
jgi:hypothetical protein